MSTRRRELLKLMRCALEAMWYARRGEGAIGDVFIQSSIVSEKVCRLASKLRKETGPVDEDDSEHFALEDELAEEAIAATIRLIDAVLKNS